MYIVCPRDVCLCCHVCIRSAVSVLTWPDRAHSLPVCDPHVRRVLPRRSGHPAQSRWSVMHTRTGHHSWAPCIHTGTLHVRPCTSSSLVLTFEYTASNFLESRRSHMRSTRPRMHRVGACCSVCSPRPVVVYRMYRRAVDVHIQYTSIGCDGSTV